MDDFLVWSDRTIQTLARRRSLAITRESVREAWSRSCHPVPPAGLHLPSAPPIGADWLPARFFRIPRPSRRLPSVNFFSLFLRCVWFAGPWFFRT